MTETALPPLHHIVVVGGGAGGLVLATVLGRRLGRQKRARITLVDQSLTHVWKPLLHEIAAGTLNADFDSVGYLSHAKAHHFRFMQGEMAGLDRAKKQIWLAPVRDIHGRELVPSRAFDYDTLVLAVGSTANDFGVPGVAENCIFLDNQRQAEDLQQRLLHDFLRAQVQPGPLRPGQLHIAIIGAGATGVELAAELHRSTRELVAYGLDRIDREHDVKLTLIEAAPTVLPALSRRLQDATEQQLDKLGIELLTNEQVTEVTPEAVLTKSGHRIASEIKIWCAGVKAPAFTTQLDGLETNRIGQLVVDQTLRSSRDEAIFALGDCAACPQPGASRPVPPRAQAAYQEAYALADTLARRLRHQPPQPFVYKDYGSLVSLSYSVVGNLMGNLFGSWMVEGIVARLTYLSLYRKHQMALHGLLWTIKTVLARLFIRGTQPELKLH